MLVGGVERRARSLITLICFLFKSDILMGKNRISFSNENVKHTKPKLESRRKIKKQKLISKIERAKKMNKRIRLFTKNHRVTAESLQALKAFDAISKGNNLKSADLVKDIETKAFLSSKLSSLICKLIFAFNSKGSLKKLVNKRYT